MARAISSRKMVMWTALAWGIGLLIFFPILWTFLTSFKSEATAISDPPVWFFFDWTTENYGAVLARSNYPLALTNSIIIIVSWQWLPFATLILLTAIQSLDGEQLEASEMDGAPALKRFWYIILPHLSRAITVVILIQTIFLLSVFAEIFVTTGGAFGTKTLSYLIFQRVLESQNIGLGSAGGVSAIILANIVAIFLMRIVGKNLDN